MAFFSDDGETGSMARIECFPALCVDFPLVLSSGVAARNEKLRASASKKVGDGLLVVSL